MKKIISVLVLVFVLLSVVSCGKELAINLNGGTMDESYLKNADFEDVIVATPTKEGYVFAGWYADGGFNEYIDPQNITREQEKAGRAFAKWITVEEHTYNVREGEATITDSGVHKQQLDTIRIADNYNIADLKRAGYTSFKLTVSFECREEDDGYQHMMIYNSTTRKSNSSVGGWFSETILGDSETDPALIDQYDFEIDADGVGKEWRSVTYETTIYFSAIKDNLYICGDASGNLNDDWYNRNIVVTVMPP